jgi:hypothetical protein
MSVKDLLVQHQEKIIDKWFTEVLNTYPEETAKFIRREKNPFANPVGAGLRAGLLGIFEQFVHGIDEKAASGFLDGIVRVRAIQEFSPARAVGFLYGLKRLVRSELEKEMRDGAAPVEEFFDFDARVDELALLAFNVYTSCRERLFEVKVEEIKAKSYRLLQRANLLEEFSGSEEESGIKNQ